jgi:hypothetical protein
MKADGRVAYAGEEEPVDEAARKRTPDVRASDVVAVPVVATSLVTSLRMFVRELGLVDEVRAAILAADPFASYWIDQVPESDFVPVDRYLAVWGALGRLVPAERLRALGRQRFEHSMDSGRIAPILRGWARTCQDHPTELVRVAPHLWRGLTRGLGELRVVSEDATSCLMLIDVVHPRLASTSAWHRVVEGWGDGLVSLMRGGRPLAPQQGVTVSLDAQGRIEALLRWA